MCSKTGDAVGTIYNINNNMEYYPFRNDLYNLEKILAKYDNDININNNSDINKTLDYIRNHVNKSMILFIITDLEGMETINELYFRELSMMHDIMLINITDGCIYGKNVYDMDADTYFPNIFTKNKDLFEQEAEMKDNLFLTCLNKMSKYRVSVVSIDNISEIPMKIIKLLEEYKYANRH